MWVVWVSRGIMQYRDTRTTSRAMLLRRRSSSSGLPPWLMARDSRSLWARSRATVSPTTTVQYRQLATIHPRNVIHSHTKEPAEVESRYSHVRVLAS